MLTLLFQDSDVTLKRVGDKFMLTVEDDAMTACVPLSRQSLQDLVDDLGDPTPEDIIIDAEQALADDVQRQKLAAQRKTR